MGAGGGRWGQMGAGGGQGLLSPQFFLFHKKKKLAWLQRPLCATMHITQHEQAGWTAGTCPALFPAGETACPEYNENRNCVHPQYTVGATDHGHVEAEWRPQGLGAPGRGTFSNQARNVKRGMRSSAGPQNQSVSVSLHILN